MTPHALLAGFLLLLPLHSQAFPYGLQVADAALLLLFAATTLNSKRWPLGLRLPDLMLFGYLSASALAVALAPSPSGWLALIKQAYGAMIYIAFALLADQGAALIAVRWMAVASSAVAALGLVAVGRFALTGATTAALGEAMPLPYLGTVFRLTGFFETPEMLVEYFTVAIPLAVGLALRREPPWARWWKGGAVASAVAALLTFGRGLPGLLVSLLFFLWPSFAHGQRRWLGGGLALVAVAGVIAVNLSLAVAIRQVSLSHDFDRTVTAPEYPYAFHDAAAGAPRAILSLTYNPMSYLLLKRTAIEAFSASPLTGIGLERFPEATERAFQAGSLHERYRAAKPHSTWLGRLAETGVIGGLTLAGFWLGALLWGFRTLRETPPANAWTVRALLAGTLGLVLNSINVDVMNMRFLWIILGLMRGLRGSLRGKELIPRGIDHSTGV